MRTYKATRKESAKLKAKTKFCVECGAAHADDSAEAKEHTKHLVDFKPGLNSVSVGGFRLEMGPTTHTYTGIPEILIKSIESSGEFTVTIVPEKANPEGVTDGS